MHYALPEGEDEPNGVVLRVAQISLVGSVMRYFPFSLLNFLPKASVMQALGSGCMNGIGESSSSKNVDVDCPECLLGTIAPNKYSEEIYL